MQISAPAPGAPPGPPGPPPPAPAPVAAPVDHWVETVDPSTGKTYFYHKKTRAVLWQRPSPEEQRRLAQEEAAQRQAAAAHVQAQQQAQAQAQQVQVQVQVQAQEKHAHRDAQKAAMQQQTPQQALEVQQQLTQQQAEQHAQQKQQQKQQQQAQLQQQQAQFLLQQQSPAKAPAAESAASSLSFDSEVVAVVESLVARTEVEHGESNKLEWYRGQLCWAYVKGASWWPCQVAWTVTAENGVNQRSNAPRKSAMMKGLVEVSFLGSGNWARVDATRHVKDFRKAFAEMETINKKPSFARALEVARTLEQDFWVECEICGKWRIGPQILSEENLDGWRCDKNYWDACNSCSVPEAEYEKELDEWDAWEAMPIVIPGQEKGKRKGGKGKGTGKARERKGEKREREQREKQQRELGRRSLLKALPPQAFKLQAAIQAIVSELRELDEFKCFESAPWQHEAADAAAAAYAVELAEAAAAEAAARAQEAQQPAEVVLEAAATVAAVAAVAPAVALPAAAPTVQMLNATTSAAVSFPGEAVGAMAGAVEVAVAPAASAVAAAVEPAESAVAVPMAVAAAAQPVAAAVVEAVAQPAAVQAMVPAVTPVLDRTHGLKSIYDKACRMYYGKLCDFWDDIAAIFVPVAASNEKDSLYHIEAKRLLKAARAAIAVAMADLHPVFTVGTYGLESDTIAKAMLASDDDESESDDDENEDRDGCCARTDDIVSFRRRKQTVSYKRRRLEWLTEDGNEALRPGPWGWKPPPEWATERIGFGGENTFSGSSARLGRKARLPKGKGNGARPTSRNGENEETDMFFVQQYAQILKRIGAKTPDPRIRFGRSGIEGWGMYSTEFIPANQIVIEYCGELIRPKVADLREKWYQEHDKEIYMFKLDEGDVKDVNSGVICDATDIGNTARLINHSCEPNCYSHIISVPNTGCHNKKIVIVTLKDIPPRTELCYDYQIQLDDDDHKIACQCGSTKCRGWLN